MPSNGGTSIGETTLTNLTPSATLRIDYRGDPFYGTGTQQLRVITTHQRVTRH